MFRLMGAGATEMRETLAALDHSLAVIEFELDGTVRTANANFLGVMGYSLDEVKGKHHSLFVEPAYGTSAEYRQFWDRLRSGESQVAQFKRLGKGGKEIWIEASYNPIVNASGKPYRVVKYATDVSRQKAEYADLRGKMDALSKSQAMIEFTLDGRVLTANQNFLEAVGYSLAEIEGQHHAMFVAPEYAQGSEYREFWNDLRAGKFQSGQFKRLGKRGKAVWIQASYNVILDLNGEPWKVVKFAADVTARTQELNRLRERLELSFGEIDNAIERLDARATSATEATAETLQNVQTVAAAAEELSASIRQISESMVHSRQATEAAHGSTEAADTATHRLAETTKAMSGIVQLIQEIASQINLLALNATIESARAGEAGKGFAVVANEVKNLAKQAAAATARISSEIDGIQTVSHDVVGTLSAIKTSIESVRQYVVATASAVEQQAAVTGEMSASMNSASRSVATVAGMINDISAAAEQTSQAIGQNREAAKVLAR